MREIVDKAGTTAGRTALSKLSPEEISVLIAVQKDKIENCFSQLKKCIYDAAPCAESNPIDTALYFDDTWDFMDWTCRKRTFKCTKPKHIFPYDIFYCDFGKNVHEEKNKKRPVLILQQMTGYLDFPLVYVAPITTHNNNYSPDPGLLPKGQILIGQTQHGNVKGIIDLLNIRSVSKCRLSEVYLDKLIDEETKNTIRAFLKSLFAIT